MVYNQEGMIRNENEKSKTHCSQEGTIMNENTPKEDTLQQEMDNQDWEHN